MFGGFFFFWAFLWDGRALRFKSSPKGCGLYSAIPNAWLKSPLAGVLLHTASCVLVMLLLNCRFFFSPSLARMFARWLVMFPLLRCNNSHIWLTVLSCSIKRQMFNSDGDKLGYILLIVSSLLFSFFWYAARAVKRFSLDCSPIMFNRELVFSSGLFSLNNSANANTRDAGGNYRRKLNEAAQENAELRKERNRAFPIGDALFLFAGVR